MTVQKIHCDYYQFGYGDEYQFGHKEFRVGP